MLWFGVCLIAAGVVSSFETALVGLPESTIRGALDAGSKNAKKLLIWVEDTENILATLHLLRLLCFICAGVIAFNEGLHLSDTWGGWLGIALASIVALLVSHLVPRALAKRFALEWALRTIDVVRLLNLLMLPFVWTLTFISKRFTGFWGESAEETTAFWTSDELGELSNKARIQVLGAEGRELYLSLAEFSDTVIREIMVPRTEVVAIPLSSNYDDVRSVILDAGHSRIPVYEETVDNVVGLLHIKDLFVLELSQDDWVPDKDFEISVTSGKDMVANLEQGTPRSMLIGTSTNTGGAIEVSGIRKSDSKVVTSKARIVVIEPKWASDQDIAEIYTNEKYNFDMRVKSLSRDRVAIRFSSTFGDKNKIIEKSSMSVGPYKKSGKLTFETLVDDTPLKDLTHVVQVKTLPAPSVDFKRKPNTNELTLEVVTYGKSNAVDKLFPIGGISGKVIEISAEKYGNRKLTRYRLSIARPAYGGLQSVKLKIKDKYGVLNEYENEFEYLD